MGMFGQVGQATGGSGTTVIDTGLSLTADTKIGGSILIFQTTDGLAPEGEIKRVSDNTSTTYTTDAFSANVGAGDLYGYINKDFNVVELLPAVNIAFKKLGKIGIVDSSIVTVANQREYTLPVTIKAGNICGVYLETNPDDSDDPRYVPLYGWRVVPSAAAATALLVLDKQYDAGLTIRIEYIADHPAFSSFASEIHESIPAELAKAAMKFTFASSRNEEAIASQDGFRDLYNSSRDEFNEAKRMHPIWKPKVIVPARTFGRF